MQKGYSLDEEFELAASASRLLGSRYFRNAVSDDERKFLFDSIIAYLDSIKAGLTLDFYRASPPFGPHTDPDYMEELSAILDAEDNLKVLVNSHIQRNLDYERSCLCPGCGLDLDRTVTSLDKFFICKRCSWQKDPRYRVQNWGKAGRCPQCGFVYRWDGQFCGHCKYEHGVAHPLEPLPPP